MIEKLNQERDYNIRLMPNVNDPSNPTLSLEMMDKNSKLRVNKTFSYVLLDNKLTIAILPNQLVKYIKLFAMGYISLNSDNLILGDSEVKYYTYDDKGILTTFTKDDDVSNTKELKKDIIYFTDNYNLYNIKEGYRIKFNVNKIDGFINPNNFIFDNSTEPLYKEGESKDKILNLYKDIETLEHAVEDYKSKLKEKYSNFLFDEEIKPFLMNSL